MVDHEYYIALNIVTRKGLQQFFREALVSCKKAHLLDFLNKEVDERTGYSRPFIIAPLFAIQPNYMISINDEACIRYSQSSK